MTNDEVANVWLQPKPWRVALGFLLAPLVPAALWLLPSLWHGTSMHGYGSQLLLVAIYGGYPATILLGLPAYVALRRRLSPRLITIALAGGLVAAAQWLVLQLVLANPDQAQIGNCRTVVDGQTTWCGFLESTKFIALVFGLGAIGGTTFWVCAAWRLKPRWMQTRTGGHR